MSKTVLLPASVVLALVTACVAALLVASTRPAEAAFPGTNGVIAYQGDCQLAGIFRVRPDGTGVTPLTCDLAAFAQHPAFSADGKRIAFQNDADDVDEFGRDLWVMDANGENRTQITDTPNVDEWQPSWFPSGRKIAYRVVLTTGGSGIEVLTLDDTGRRVVKTTRLTDDGSDPAVSPNGQRLVFVSDRDGDLEVYVMRTDVPEGPDNRPRQLTFNQTYRDTAPNWSPGGSKIVFARRDALGTTPHNSDIFVMNADGTGKKNLTRSPEFEGEPAFSPDGRFIAYGRNNDLWRMRADGTRPTFITADGTQPDWQPRP